MKKTVIDVRTPEEFLGGHGQGSINIPLQDIPNKLEVLRQLPQPLVLCCASGNRSGQAMLFLKSHGLECSNAGSWQNVR